MSYFDLLPIGRSITFKGLTLTVRAVWSKGAICRTETGAIYDLTGSDLKEIKLDS